MTRKQHLVGIAVTALVLAAYSGAAYGEPAPTPPPAPSGFLHMRSSSTLRTDGGSELRLPPGYFMDEPTYDKLDAETRRLQDAELRLTVENKSLRKSASGWQPGWYTIAGFVATSLVAGWYLHDHI
jgi:hypothetical protein